ncbi:hypothetical protein NLI96_g345 [Meripilus lineatus]|uniref:Amino acid permease/ SLC12A domain-containing protein n=1 Tax=Meripilus lineatus TaxID=2056292 RepID=A0AAD5VCN2_9APHY|nr:hypothetical protein NLI96_g345 [Physisporinus lineatus]
MSSQDLHEKNSALDVSADLEEAVPDAPKLQRKLKNRHVAMISIGGVIGTGLFLGTATALQNGGPVGILLGYSAVGSICYVVMISLGEMIAFLPVPGGHITLAERFVDPALSFALGWNYCAYGEAEFLFASIKVITITGLIILGIVLDLGGGPSHDRIGFRYWKNPGPFAQFNGIPGAKGRFLAWWSVMTQAAFSFIGTEVVAIAGGETKNPRRNIPKAIRRVYIRLLLFYVGGVAIIGLLVPYDDPDLGLKRSDAAKSPFVIAIRHAGIKGLPSVINAALLSSPWSAASSELYSSSRAIYTLSVNGSAPRIFSRVSKHGLPYVAVGFQSLFGLLAYMGIKSGSGRVFGWFGNMTSIAGLASWFGICVTYIRFQRGLKAQGISRKTLPFTSPLQPFAAYYGAVSCLFICITSGWTVFLKDNWATDLFVTNYLPLALFPILYVGARWWKGTTLVKPKDMDFVGGLAEVEAASYDEPPPRNWAEKFWGWLVSQILILKP